MAEKRKRTPEGIALGDRVARARKYATLKVKELAGAIKVEWQTIQAIEAGFVRRSGYTVQIARACGVSAWWLATGEGGMLDKDIPMSPPERTLLLEYRAIEVEEGKGQVMANIRYWREIRLPGGGAKPIRKKRVTKPPLPGDARRGTNGRGNSGG